MRFARPVDKSISILDLSEDEFLCLLANGSECQCGTLKIQRGRLATEPDLTINPLPCKKYFHMSRLLALRKFYWHEISANSCGNSYSESGVGQLY